MPQITGMKLYIEIHLYVSGVYLFISFVNINVLHAELDIYWNQLPYDHDNDGEKVYAT
jgi:hypothetical protein